MVCGESGIGESRWSTSVTVPSDSLHVFEMLSYGHPDKGIRKILPKGKKLPIV